MLKTKNYFFIFLLAMLVGCTSTNGSSNNIESREEYLLLRGMNYSAKGDFLAAIKELNQAYKKNPKNIVTLRELGFAYGNLEELEKSLKMYNEALAIDPKDVISIKNIAYAYYSKGDIESSKKYLDMLPVSAEDYFTNKIRGLIAIKEKNTKQAYAFFQKSIKTVENYDEELIKNYVDTLLSLKKTKEAYDYLETKSSEYGSQKSFVLLYSDYLERVYGEREKAERTYKRFLAEVSKDDDVMMALARNLINQGKNQESLLVLELVSENSIHGAEYKELKKLALTKKASVVAKEETDKSEQGTDQVVPEEAPATPGKVIMNKPKIVTSSATGKVVNRVRTATRNTSATKKTTTVIPTK